MTTKRNPPKRKPPSGPLADYLAFLRHKKAFEKKIGRKISYEELGIDPDLMLSIHQKCSILWMQHVGRVPK